MTEATDKYVLMIDGVKKYLKEKKQPDDKMDTWNPHQIAQAKKEAIIDYRTCRRLYKKLTALKEHKTYIHFLFFRFQANEKNSVDDAKAKAKTHKEILEITTLEDEAESLMDETYAELERVITKIEQMADANATARAEMKLGSLTP